MSLDGFVAQRSASTTGYGALDRAVEGLQQWMFPAVLPRILMLAGGGEEGRDNDIVRDTLERTGASVMRERMFGPGEQPWPGGSVPPAGLRRHAREA